MPATDTPGTQPAGGSKAFLGLTRSRRYKIYGWGALALLLSGVGYALWYLRPDRWYKYTDQVAFEQVARDVQPGYVLWESATPIGEGIAAGDEIRQPAISSDGVHMVYGSGIASGDANLFLRVWDGNTWGAPRPMRALNSKFNETAPAFSGDGKLLFFSSDRPGGRGGFDIWVAKWDGAEYAWPLPLSEQVNTPFDETDPAPSSNGLALYFASNRPHQAVGIGVEAAAAAQLEDVSAHKVDFDLYAADLAGDLPFDLLVEQQLSMLYSLREGALADPVVMAKLGGSPETEAAVGKALAFLAGTQEPDGRWDLGKNKGTAGHDVAATAFSLLAFYGRGERHDVDCKYRDNVKRGLDWLLSQQNVGSGDLRGPSPRGHAMYDQGIATLALVEAYGVTKDTALRPRVIAAIEFLTDSQHEGGGWRYSPREAGDLSVTGWMVMALASAEMSGIPVPEKTQAGVAKFLKFVSGGNEGGAYGYTDAPGKGARGGNAMDVVGFFCAQLHGASANAARAFESALITKSTGFKLQDVYYTYYGTLAAYQHQGPLWREWKEKMHVEFLKAQAGDGSWTPAGPHAGGMGPVIGTALVTLCLEAHYRYSPLYGLGFEPDPAGPNPNVIDGEALPATPHFRHARHLAALSSPADDLAPVITDHGDFIYFASRRAGGFGGLDIYRSRVSGEVPAAPVNLGPEINSTADESDPGVRMAGFHLLFNSNRDGNAAGLYSAKSKRVVRRFDYAGLPSSVWLWSNLGWLITALLALIFFLRLAYRAFRPLPAEGAPVDTMPDKTASISSI
ncbi:MAG: hypothetical protein DVB27_07160 [Verrucomicrobia bacterium]|nr:MAG: hypothetical protein DVB27_07160 [Verrucomicrobiota bacterium]